MEGRDDPNYVATTQQLFVRPQINLKLWNGRWHQYVGYGISRHAREDRNGVDSAHPVDSSESSYRGNVYRADWQHTIYLHKYTTLLAGLESEQEQGSSLFRSKSSFGDFENVFPKRTARTTGYYLQPQLHVGDFFAAAAGVRVDRHTRFGYAPTYRLAPVLSVDRTRTRLKGTYGTGFKAPSLFQLYAPFGNPALKAAKSAGWDVGIEQYDRSERFGVGATYFRNRFTNQIDFDNSTFTYGNIARAETQGVEVFGRAEPRSGLRFYANYTRTEAKDRLSGLSLLRRPRHKWGVETTWDTDRTSLYGSVTIIGKRIDNDFSVFPATRVILKKYELVNLSGSIRVATGVQLFGRIDNLLDRSYEEVLGFGVPGFSAYGGIRLIR